MSSEECILKHFILSACHSLITDPHDSSWRKYFSDIELEEIGNKNLEPLPTLPTRIINHLKSFKLFDSEKNPTGMTVDQIMDYKIDESGLDLEVDYDIIWINRSVANATQLYRWKYFPLNNHTESDLLRRVWSFVELCLDNVYIQTRGGEKMSMVSSSRKNETHLPPGAAPMKRKAIGRRGDLIFVKGGIEVGCGELGRVDSSAKGTKEILKTPKMMKDQLAFLISKRPDKKKIYNLY
ncbi:hypothetical protein INT45_014029 [Circinella minor]|uniref:Uncharacterized protein n=1 Tax=Circinella minor TaxID=1195481 RepID=A0A8H7VI36_9FUNG|nr:hypothetical protein INT45_014029 [Circinella minor]